MSVLVRAVEVFDSIEGDFTPVLGVAPGVAPGWTLRDVLLTALGCDRRAGAVAYFEYRELGEVLGEVDRILRRAGGLSIAAERWANERDRTFSEVRELLVMAAAAGGPVAPYQVTLRPYCRVGVVRTCRVPFISSVVLLGRWLQVGGSAVEFLEQEQIGPAWTSFTVLSEFDDLVREFDAGHDLAAWGDWVRSWVLSSQGRSSEGGSPDPLRSPPKLLRREAALSPWLDLDEFVERAHEVHVEESGNVGSGDLDAA